MSRRTPPRSRGRRTPDTPLRSLLRELGLEDLSWPVVGWTLVVLALGFGPLLLSTLVEAGGVAHRALVALGPALVCLAFAGLTWHYGPRAGAPKRRATRTWLLTGLFVALAALAAWGLYMVA